MATYGSLNNLIADKCYKDNVIKIGAGVTELMWSDCHPYYITGINYYPKTSKYAGEIKSLELAYAKILKYHEWTEGGADVAPYDNGKGIDENKRRITVFYNRKTGNFTQDGTKDATVFRIGRAEYYRDPSF